MDVIIYEVIAYEENSYYDDFGMEYLCMDRVDVNSFTSKVQAVRIAQKSVASKYAEAYVYRCKIGANGISERKCVYRKLYRNND